MADGRRVRDQRVLRTLSGAPTIIIQNIFANRITKLKTKFC